MPLERRAQSARPREKCFKHCSDIDDILASLNDVLMPRQLEVHLDDDFQAVREALRQRLATTDS